MGAVQPVLQHPQGFPGVVLIGKHRVADLDFDGTPPAFAAVGMRRNGLAVGRGGVETVAERLSR